MKASVFMAMRSELLLAVEELDAEIDTALAAPRSQRAAARAKRLFLERERLSRELEQYGVHVEQHPAVYR